MSNYNNLDDVFAQICHLYDHAIRNHHVGRGTLMKEFNLSRTDAEEALDRIRADEYDSEKYEDINPPTSEEGNLEDDDDDNTNGWWRTKKKYTYDPTQECYFFRLDCYEGAPYAVSVNKLSRLFERYSNYNGDPWTINQVCTAEGMPREAFIEIKEAMGMTHDSPPRLPQEFKTKDAELMAEDDVQRAKFTWKKSFQRIRIKDLQRDAKNWVNIEETLDQSNEIFTDLIANYEVPQLQVNVASKSNLEDAVLVLPIHDLHFGKRAEISTTGNLYNKSVASDSARTHTQRVLERASSQANIQKIVTVCGTSDFLHVDQAFPARTTNGTPQDTDGPIEEIIGEGQMLMVELIDMMRTISPVHVMYTPGNHDRVLSIAMHNHGKAFYRKSEDVTFSDGYRNRNYYGYGKNAMCFLHGDIKKKQISNLGTLFGREFGMRPNSMVITGHKHFLKAEDRAGLQLIQMPTISGSGRWSDRQAYDSMRGIEGILLHAKQGVTGRPSSYIMD